MVFVRFRSAVGTRGDNFYVIERGRFKITVQRRDGRVDTVQRPESGESFGELALMYGTNRQASVEVSCLDGIHVIHHTRSLRISQRALHTTRRIILPWHTWMGNFPSLPCMRSLL